MTKYKTGKIYQIQFKIDNNEFYIGSTKNPLCLRMACHRYNIQTIKNALYDFVNAHGGWDNFESEIIEKYPCRTKIQLHKKEQELITKLEPTLNKKCAYLTKKQKKANTLKYSNDYYYAHREEKLKYFKEYAKLHADEMKENQKEYRAKRKAFSDAIKNEFECPYMSTS